MTEMEFFAEITGFPGIVLPAGASIKSNLILLTVLGMFNLIFSLIGATAVLKSRSIREYDTLLGCVVFTGFINMLAAYMRRAQMPLEGETWFSWAFTMSLVLDSVLNVSTAGRIMWAYSRVPLDADEESLTGGEWGVCVCDYVEEEEEDVEEGVLLPLYISEKTLPVLLEVSGDSVWPNEKTRAWVLN